MFVSKETFGQKFFWDKNICGSKKILVRKIFGQKDSGPKILYSKKEWVGLTQGEGCVSPQPHHHPENSRVEIVLGCC